MAPVSSWSNYTGKLNRRRQGMGYERLARHYLEQAGLTFVAAGVCVCGGEIDLIMRDDNVWVFVEVRYRRDARFGGAAASVTRQKQQRLLHAAAVWLASRQASFDTTACRFDVVAITGKQLEWLTDAFNCDTQGR